MSAAVDVTRDLLAFPEGSFSVIYADPPWPYSNRTTRSSAEKHYRTISLRELAALPVGRLAKTDAALVMWATPPLLRDAINLGESWGFRYKTILFCWAKRNPKSNTPFFGLGNYTRANVEPVLLFVRGAIKRADAGVPQFLWSRRLRHSEKPDEIRDRIVRLFGDVPRIELFARHVRPGWTYAGNQLLDQ